MNNEICKTIFEAANATISRSKGNFKNEVKKDGGQENAFLQYEQHEYPEEGKDKEKAVLMTQIFAKVHST